MKTIFSIVFLIVFGVIANYLILFIVNLAGFPGALLAGKPGKRSKAQFIFGSIMSALGQSYLYLAYTAFIVNWTMKAISKQGVIFIIWPIAFLSVMLPLWINLTRARLEAQEMEHGSAPTEALHITFFVSLAGFFIFAFIPTIMVTLYDWVPYIGN